MTYRIVRHCSDPSTREPGEWFDGYEAEGGSLALEATYPDRNERGTP